MRSEIKPNIAWIELTTFCNNNCNWCYSKCSDVQGEILSFPKLQLILKFLSAIDCKKIVFIGGEPTLYPDILEAIHLAVSEENEVTIVTNGRLLTNSFLDKVGCSKKSLSFTVSLHGHRKNIHEKETCSLGSYVETIAGIENCIDRGFYVATNTTVTKKNVQTVPMLIKWANSKKLPSIGIGLGLPSFCKKIENNEVQEDLLLPSEFAHILDSYVPAIISSDLRLHITIPIPICFFSEKIKKIIKEGKIRTNRCHMFSGTGIVINVKGEICPCTHLSAFSLQNVFALENKNVFLDFWNNSMEKIRTQIRKYPNSFCVDCSSNFQCLGGCPLLWKYSNPSSVKGGV